MSEESHSVLQHRTNSNFSLTAPAIKATTHFCLFFFTCNDGTFSFFDSTTNTMKQLAPMDSSITATANCLAIAPNHSYGAACFGDGSVQFWDFSSGKSIKALVGALKSNASNCAFTNETTLLVCGIDRTLTFFKVSDGFFGLSFKEQPLGVHRSFVRQLVLPPCRKPTDIVGKKVFDQAKIVSPFFANLLGIVYYDKFVLANVENDIKTIAEYNGEKGVATFSISNAETLFFAFATQKQGLQVFNYVQGSQPEKVYTTILTGKQPSTLNFLSDTMLAVVYEDNSATVVYFAENKAAQTILPFTGPIAQSNESFYILSKDGLHEMFLSTFQETIEEFQREKNVLGSIDLARRALRGDPGATVGLPANHTQRQLVIERTLSNLLLEDLSNRLEGGESSKSVLDFIMPVCAELGLQEWLIRQSLQVFEEFGGMNDFFDRIVETDPTATLFTYTPEFIEQLIDSNPTRDITKFLEGLPSKAASASSILKYAVPHKSTELIANVYLRRLQDPVSAVSVFEVENQFDRIAMVFETGEHWGKREYSGLLEWLFALKDGRFPRFEKLYKVNSSITIKTIIYGADFIDKNKKPFTLVNYVNALFVFLEMINPDQKDPLYKAIEGIIVDKEVTLSGRAVKFLSSRTFSNEFAEPDRREDLILQMCQSIGYERRLVPLCRKFGFTDAEREILTKNGDFGQILRDIIEKKGNPFEFIQENQNKDAIKFNSNALALIDSHKLLHSIPPDWIEEIAKSMSGIVKNVFIRFALQSKISTIDLDPEETIDFIKFLAVHYPNEVIPAIKSYVTPEMASSLLPICEERRIAEACAVLASMSGDLEKAISLLIPIWSTSFAVEILHDICASKQITPELAQKLIAGTAYVLSVSGHVGMTQASFKQVIAELELSLSKPQIMEAMVKGLSGVDQGYVRELLKNYLLGMRISPNEGQKLISCGLSCSSCHQPLFDGEHAALILDCGHCVHDDSNCLREGKCPICSAEPTS